MSVAIGKITTAGVALILCAAPLAALNVWPRVSQMWQQGAASGSDVGVVLLVMVAALLMAAVPFAMEKAANWGFWLVCLVFGIGLATLNYALAVGAIGKVRDLSAGPVRELVHKAAGLNSRIDRARNSRTQLPQFSWTTAAGVAVAKRAADAAATTREDECRKRGPFCRDREGDERTALAAFTAAEADRALTEQAEGLDADVRRWEQELAALGAIPDNIDAQAARLAKVVGRFVDLGDTPLETVADAVISSMSVFAELIGLLGPRIVITALARKDAPAPQRSWSIPRWRRKAPAALAPAPESAAVVETPATAAPRKKASKIKAAAVREFGSVREWKESRTTARADSRVKPGDAHSAYKSWCVENAKEPVTLTAFGTMMKGDLGVSYEERNKRGFYVGIALVSAPKLVATVGAGIAVGARA